MRNGTCRHRNTRTHTHIRTRSSYLGTRAVIIKLNERFHADKPSTDSSESNNSKSGRVTSAQPCTTLYIPKHEIQVNI